MKFGFKQRITKGNHTYTAAAPPHSSVRCTSLRNMKEKIITSVILLLFSVSSFAQKVETVYYNSSWNVMGKTETLLIPDKDVFLLKRIYYGKLGGTTVDTLHINNGILKGKKLEVSFSDSRMVLHFLGDGNWTKRLKYKEYDVNSPFVIERRHL